MGGFLVNLTGEKLSDILNGEWIVPPKENFKFETVTISKEQARLEKGKLNLFIAIDEETWDKGSGNRGIYKGWQDTHKIVHEFASDLSGVIVGKKIEDIDENIPQLLVTNTYAAIKKLAIFIRDNYTGQVVAITGTAGKSSTKNMLNQCLKKSGTVLATRGNHNTRTGVPLTIACAINNPDYLILETAISALWMRSGGISKLAKPHITLITSIGGGQQKTPLETAELKAKICEGIVPGGYALLNKEMLHFDEVKKKVEGYGAKVITYGLKKDADIYLIESTPKQAGTSVQAKVFDQKIDYDLSLLGEGMILNSLAVLGIASLLHLDLEKISREFKNMKGNDSVLQFESIKHYKKGSYTLIDDSWNATELSMLEAIDILKQQKQFHKGRSVAILGRIVNLGQDAKRQHKQMVQPLIDAKVDLVFAHGKEMKYVLDDLPNFMVGGFFEDAKACAKAATQFIEPGDLVLLKGSRRASDFKIMKKELVKYAKKKPVLKYKSLGNPLAKTHGAITFSMSDERELAVVGDQAAKQKQGIGNVLLLSLILDGLFSGKIHLTDSVKINARIARESKTPRSIPLKEGEIIKFSELLQAFIIHDSPNAILALAIHLFGSTKKAHQAIQQLAKKLSIQPDAVKNVTGRRISNRDQLTTLDDLVKAAKYLFDRLPHELTLLNHTSTIIKNNELMSYSHLIDSQIATHSFMYGQNRSIGLALIKLKEKSCISIVLGARDAFHRDYLIGQSISAFMNEENLPKINPVNFITKKRAYKVNVLADTYFGEFYTDIRKRRKREDALTKYDYHHSFKKIRPILNEGDFNIANFEAALTDEKTSKLKPIKPYVLYANPELTVDALKKEGIHAVTLGNNHLMDFGEKGLEKTIYEFKEVNITPFGAGKTSKDAETPLVHIINGKRIVYFSAYWYRHPMHRKFNFYASSFAPGVACLSGGLIEQIKREKINYPESKVIVFAHWGVDFKTVHKMQRSYAHVLVNAGADLILGHGAHMMQEIEKINNSWVVYSLGNGIFNSNGEYKKHHAPPYSFIAQLNLTNSHDTLKLYPFYSDNLATFWQPHPVTKEQFNHLLDIQKSYGLEIDSKKGVKSDKDELGFLIEINL